MLDSIIEKFGLDAVSKKTRISKKNLEKLLRREFSTFSKPKALGFISILEREYKEDFSDLRNDIVEWFKSENSQEDQITFPPPEKPNRTWITIVPLILVVAFGFYLYKNEFSNSQMVNDNSISMKSVEKIYKEEDSQKSKESQNNKTELSVEDNGSLKKIDKEPAKNIVDKNISADNSLDKNSSIKPYVPVEDIVVVPDKRMWIGVIDLENRKRKSKIVEEAFNIENGSEKLIVTGHGFFDISDAEGNNFVFRDPNKHYFLLKDGMVEEISSKEFKGLNGGKVW
jgi:hypothetical protein